MFIYLESLPTENEYPRTLHRLASSRSSPIISVTLDAALFLTGVYPLHLPTRPDCFLFGGLILCLTHSECILASRSNSFCLLSNPVVLESFSDLSHSLSHVWDNSSVGRLGSSLTWCMRTSERVNTAHRLFESRRERKVSHFTSTHPRKNSYGAIPTVSPLLGTTQPCRASALPRGLSASSILQRRQRRQTTFHTFSFAPHEHIFTPRSIKMVAFENASFVFEVLHVVDGKE